VNWVLRWRRMSVIAESLSRQRTGVGSHDDIRGLAKTPPVIDGFAERLVESRCVSRGAKESPTAIAGGVQAFHHKPCEAAIEQTVPSPKGRAVGGLVCQNSIIYGLGWVCRANCVSLRHDFCLCQSQLLDFQAEIACQISPKNFENLAFDSVV
jgi:hypothetical protein